MQVLCDDDLYIMQRLGWQNQSGLVFVLNNRGFMERRHCADEMAKYQLLANGMAGNDLGQPLTKCTSSDGNADFWAPPRGYDVYTPQ
jgi:alpha-amylase